MSRHRIVRSMNYSDEYEGYDEVYGHSVEDDYCISPSDVAQFMYNRETRNQSMASYLKENAKSIEEVDEVDASVLSQQKGICDDLEKAKFESCIEKMQATVGDAIPRQTLAQNAVKFGYDPEKALDAVLENNVVQNNFVKPVIKDEISIPQSSSPPQISLASLINHHNRSKTDPKVKFGLGLGKRINFKKKPLFTHSDDEVEETDMKQTEILNISNSNSTSDVPNNDNFKSLADLTAFHLKSSPSVISNSNNINGVTDSLSDLNINVCKSEDTCKFQKQHEKNKPNNDNWTIDLTIALCNTRPVKPTKKPVEEEEIFIPQFVECELVPRDHTTFMCTLDISDLSSIRFPLQKTSSSFGKMLCKRFYKHVPCISHSFKDSTTNDIQHFSFDCLSPDDVIKMRLFHRL